MMPDVAAAVVAYLVEDDEVYEATEGRIFGAELPRAEAASMPRACVVVQASSGGFGVYQRSWAPLGNSRVDVRCFGADPFGAMAVYRAVHPALKRLTRRSQGDTLLYSITPSIGASQLREPDTGWPFVFASYNVFAAEVAVI